jgi:uncharacterized Zn-binding protein involved in type VI secretion
MEDNSKGHAGYPPTPIVNPNNGTVYVNGRLAATVGGSFNTHSKSNNPTHFVDVERKISSREGSVYIEGNLVARIGDAVDDGDSCEDGSTDVISGG